MALTGRIYGVRWPSGKFFAGISLLCNAIACGRLTIYPNCKKIIWILATNLETELIRKFAAQHIKNHYQEQQKKKVPFDDLRDSVRQVVSDALGAPLTGRLTEIVPFLPFDKDEQAVATYKFMRERRIQVRGAIDIEAKSFLKHIFLILWTTERLPYILQQRPITQN